jgi:hypothetical protein
VTSRQVGQRAEPVDLRLKQTVRVIERLRNPQQAHRGITAGGYREDLHTPGVLDSRRGRSLNAVILFGPTVRGADSQSGRSHRESREKELCCQGREDMLAPDNIRMSTQTLTIQRLLETLLGPRAPRHLLREWSVLGTMILGVVFTSAGCGLIHQCTNRCPAEQKHNAVCGCSKPK